VGHPQDAVERRADLVADVGQELALGLTRRLGRLLGPAQFGLGPLALGDVATSPPEADQIAVVENADEVVQEMARRAVPRPVARLGATEVEAAADKRAQVLDVVRFAARHETAQAGADDPVGTLETV